MNQSKATKHKIKKASLPKVLLLLSLLSKQALSVEIVPLEDIPSAYLSILDPNFFCKHRRVALFTDKPVYKNGETVRVTAYFYHLLTKKPLNRCRENLNVSLQIYDSKNSFLTSLSPDKASVLSPDLSTVNFSLEITAETAGGAYRINFDDGTIKDEITYFVLKFSNKAFAIVGDWNSDIISDNFLLKGKLTVKALTTELETIENGTIGYSFLDEKGNILASHEEPLLGNSLQVNFQVPQLAGKLLVFSASVNSESYQGQYKKDFYKANNDEIVIDFTLARGKLVLGFANLFYFQSFADKSRVDTIAFKDAQLILKTGETNTNVQTLSSDDDGRGSFIFTPTSQHLQDKSLLFLRVKFPELEPRDFSVIDFSYPKTSPVLLEIPKLIFKSSDSIAIVLKSQNFIENLQVVLQDKTNVIFKSPISVGSSSGTGPFSQILGIPLFQFPDLAGGVYTLQVYGPEPEPSPAPETPPPPSPAPEPKPVPLANAVLAAPAEKAFAADGEVVRPIIADPVILPPIPVVDPLVNFGGEVLQEADIFIKPPAIIGAYITLDKSYYLPGEQVSGTIRLRRFCLDCDRNPSEANIRAFVIVTDDSAFLEIEKSRENPSLFTKVFLQKEVFSPISQFKNSHRFIEHLFNGNSLLTIGELQAADARLEFLLGNQNRRKFLFDPDHLQDFVNNPWDAKFSEVSDHFNYLIPQSQQNKGYVPVYKREDLNVINDNPAANVIPVPVSPPRPGAEDTSSAEIQKELRKDTILYERLSGFLSDQLKFDFKLPGPVTNFSVRVFLFNDAGRYGFTENSVKVRKPLNIVIDEPLYIYTDETFVIRVTLENNLSTSVTVKFTSPISAPVTIRSYRSVSRSISFQASGVPVKITILDSGDQLLVEKTLHPAIIKAGIRNLSGKSGYVSTKADANSSLVFLENLPVQLIKGNNLLSVCYQNNVISLILEIVKNYNRIPSGCFEQASMTTFPIIIAIRILKLLPQTPEVIQLIKELIEKLRKGIDLLLTYECPSGGFEWFGVDPAQVTLTAYGVWQFDLIAKLSEPALAFDAGVIQRSKDFINANKNREGGFNLRVGYDELGNPDQMVSDIFVIFVLSGAISDFDALFEPEYNYVKSLYQQFKDGTRTLDSYKLALIGLLFVNKNELALATEIVAVLASRQDVSSGEILQGLTTITRSTGVSLAIETTSLTMLLILRLKDLSHNLVLERALKFLLANLKGGYFLSTQATVLSLLAISEYLAAHSQTAVANVSFDVQLNSLPAQAFSIDTANSFESKCLDLSQLLAQIENSSLPVKVEVRPGANSLSEADNQYLFAISLETYSYLPNSTPNSPIDLVVSVSQTTSTNIYSIQLVNKEAKEQGMVVLEFGKPSCFDFNINDLESLRERNLIDFYEIREANSKIVFYWRGLAASGQKTFSLSLGKRFALNNCVERTHVAYLYYGKDVSVIYRRA